MEGDSFYTLYCLKFKCPPDKFESKVLWHSMGFLTAIIARLVWLANQKNFETDLALIDAVKDLKSYSSIREIINFYNIQPQKRSFLRRYLKIRMSKGRLLNLAWLLFVKERETEKTAGTGSPQGV